MGLNWLKVVPTEHKRTRKWLAETLGKNEATISQWCANVSQPSLEKLFEIAKALEVNERVVSKNEIKNPIRFVIMITLDELTGKQQKEIIEAHNDKPEEAKPKILEKIKNLGENILSNILANIINQPSHF